MNQTKFTIPSSFGYTPTEWPTAAQFEKLQTERQGQAQAHLAWDRSLSTNEAHDVRAVVMAAYGVDNRNSNGCASLWIDWLINADEQSLFDAKNTVATMETIPQVKYLIAEPKFSLGDGPYDPYQ